MYDSPVAGPGALAATGLVFDSLWFFLAAFAIFSALLAVKRVLPAR